MLVFIVIQRNSFCERKLCSWYLSILFIMKAMVSVGLSTKVTQVSIGNVKTAVKTRRELYLCNFVSLTVVSPALCPD